MPKALRCANATLPTLWEAALRLRDGNRPPKDARRAVDGKWTHLLPAYAAMGYFFNWKSLSPESEAVG